MPSTGTMIKQILHSLYEWKGRLLPGQIGPTDSTDDVSAPTLQTVILATAWSLTAQTLAHVRVDPDDED